MVGKKENRLDFAEIMNGGKIRLAKLSQGAIGEENAYLMRTLLVSKFHQLTLARQDLEESERRPFYLYIDDFHNFVTPSMSSILSGARKYRLGLVLAHQELRQIRNEEVASAVIANPYTRVCFRLGDQDAAKLAAGFSFFEAKDLQNLGTGEAICRMERAEYDFNLRTRPLPPTDAITGRGRRQAIVSLSRKKYAARREDVEAELAKKVRTDEGEEPARDIGARRSRAETHASTILIEMPSEKDATVAPPAVAAPLTTEEALRRRKEMGPSATGGGQEPFTGVEKPTPRQPPSEPAPLGRGGPEHQHLQRLIAQWAKGMGWLTTIEKPILNGEGSVDVVLEKGALAIACEISVTTGVEQELGNIDKCVKAGFSHIAVVSTEAKHLNRIKEAASARFDSGELAKTRFCSHEDFVSFVEALDAGAMQREGAIKRRKVKVNYRLAGPSGGEERKQSVSEAMLRSFGKKKKE